MSNLTIGKEFIDHLVSKKVVPDNCRKIIIEADYTNMVTIYYEVYGDERLLDVSWGKITGMIKEKKGKE